MTVDFDIRQAVRAVIDETDLASPDEIADKVVGNVPTSQLRRVVRVLLRDFVRIELHSGRQPAPPPPVGQSSKVTAIRDAAPRWAAMLRQRVHVGNSEWKFLAECSYENLMFLATERRQNAARNLKAANGYEVLAKALTTHGVSRVEDLPTSVVASLVEDDEAAA